MIPLFAIAIAYLLVMPALGDAPIIVAIVDTGVELTHPSLKPFIWENSLEAGGRPGTDDDGNGYVDDTHGFNFVDHQGDASGQTVNDHATHVAGLVLQGFQAAGGRQIRLMSVNVYGSQIFGSPVEAMNAGIRYAARMGAQIINISATSPGESYETEGAVRDAVTWGALVVTAAGNDAVDRDEEVAFPASYGAHYPEVISVAATDLKTSELCSRSSYGALTVLIAAPGCDRSAPNGGIRSTRRGGSFGYKSGTSQAAPWVAGQLAAWLEKRPGLPTSGNEARAWLSQISHPIAGLQGKVGTGGAVSASSAR